jgi:2,3-dihydroxy-2,3-dihydro-p-cumate dehydrogenase
MTPPSNVADGAALAGQVAVVTGAAQGVGYAIARRFVRLGAKVMLADVAADALAAASARLRADYTGAEIASEAGDLSGEAAAQALHAATRRRLGEAQILVNCAGGGVILPFLEHTPETLRATIDRNLWTVLWCTRAFLPEMIAAGYGRVINIGADSVRNGLAHHAGYNAAKGGVHGLTTGLAREFARHGVTVNTVAPCALQTPQLERFEKSSPDLARQFIDVIPLGRAGEVDEVASMTAYLALPEAAFVTGQVISVNGGSTML